MRTLGLSVAGSLIGFLGSMCGVGGGLFAIPLLHYGLGIELRRAGATARCRVFATAGLSSGDMAWRLAPSRSWPRE